MGFSLALSIIACIIASVIPWRPLQINAPEEKSVPAEASAGSIAVTDVTVINVVTGAHRTGVTVLIRNGRIAAIVPEASVPPEATRLDGKGKFMIPGLWGSGAKSSERAIRIRK